MFSDDVLFEQLVLKGGNALDLIYGVTARGSVDIDFSLENDFENLPDIERRIQRALQVRFDAKGYEVFDYTFRSIPPDHVSPWGGYKIEFKVIHKDTVQQISRYPDPDRRLEQMRREATVTAPEQRRIFRIDISKNEFCQGKRETELDDFAIRVYTLEMIVIEKLRALCQQLEVYTQRRNKTARARDFFDVHAILTAQEIDLCSSENVELLRAIFAAKDVPIDFLAKIEQTREFHRPDWPAVEATVFGDLKSFDHYFDFVIQEIRKLQALGVVNSPA